MICVGIYAVPVSYTHLDVYKRQLLRRWKRDYAPKMPEEAWHPLFVEALQKQSHVEYLLDVLLSPDMEERLHRFRVFTLKARQNLSTYTAQYRLYKAAGYGLFLCFWVKK